MCLAPLRPHIASLSRFSLTRRRAIRMSDQDDNRRVAELEAEREWQRGACSETEAVLTTDKWQR